MAYQTVFNKAKSIIREDTCIKFYNKTKPLYLETDASGVRLRADLLQTRSGRSCPRDKAPANIILKSITPVSKSLLCTEKRYINIEIEAIGKLYESKSSIITALQDR